MWVLFYPLLSLGLSSTAWAHGGHYLPASGPGVFDFKPAPILPVVELRTQENKIFALPSKAPTLLLFGYTWRPDACPLILRRMLFTYQALGSPANLQLMLLSVDERDTLQTLKKYLRVFSPVLGLIGTPEAIRQIAEVACVEYNLDPGGYRLFHNDVMALLDSQGRLVWILYGVSRFSTAKLKDEVSRLLR